LSNGSHEKKAPSKRFKRSYTMDETAGKGNKFNQNEEYAELIY